MARIRWELLLTTVVAVGCGGGGNVSSSPADSRVPAVVDSSADSAAQTEGVPNPPDGDDANDAAIAPGPDTSDSDDAEQGPAEDASLATGDAPSSGTSDVPVDDAEASIDDVAQDGGAANVSPPDGSAPYSPCPPKSTPCIIMPVGDSITEGFRSSDHGGYRSELFHLALVDKKNITFVGSATPYGPNTVDNVPFPKDNDGHGGYRIDQIQALIVASLTTNKPNIVTLMIGTNDVNQNYDLSNAPTRLGTLMDTILAQDPHRVLFVATIIPTALDTLNTRVQAYNGAIPALVKTRADAGKHVVLVDMYSPFVNTANYKTVLLRGGTSDYLHPLETGYQLMGQIWYGAVKTLLP